MKLKAALAVVCSMTMLVALVPPVGAEPSPSGFDVMIGTDANRSNPSPLEGVDVAGDIYVFLLPETGPSRVRFYLDDATFSSKPLKNEPNAPWDLAGTHNRGHAYPFDTTQISDGVHTLTARIDFPGAPSERVDVEFTVQNSTATPELTLSPDPVNIEVDEDGSASATVDLAASDDTAAAFVLEADQSWVTSLPSGGTTPASVELVVDASGMPAGTHNATLTAVADGYEPASATLTMTVLGEEPEPSEVRGIHTSWTSDPATTLTVAWTQDVSAPSLEIRPVGGVDWTPIAGQVSSTLETGSMYAATATNLSPDTGYEYRIVNGASVTPTFTVATAPATGSDEAFSFVYVADTGLIGRTDGLAQATERIRNEVDSLDPLLLLGGGDYAYLDTDTRFSSTSAGIDAWFEQIEPIATSSVLMPTYGNHELSEGYLNWSSRFLTPSGHNNGRYYSFDVGSVHFVSILAGLSSQPISSGAVDWVDADMTAARQAGATWIVPFMHVAPFADGSNHPSNIALREQLGPLFEKHGVELVLTSHDQSYERTYPLKDVPAANSPTSSSLSCYDSDDGVVWAKVSPGGKLSNINQGFSTFQTNPAPHWTAVRNDTRHHYVVIEADHETLRYEALGVPAGTGPTTTVDSFEYRQGDCDDSVVALGVSPAQVSLSLQSGETEEVPVDLEASDASSTNFAVTSNQPWVVPTPASGSTPSTVTLAIDTDGLTPGDHQATVEYTAPNYQSATTTIELTVQDATATCSFESEEFGIAALPLVLDFEGDAGGLCDTNGTGTGFPRVDPPSNGTGYVPSNLLVAGGRLNVTTTAGLNSTSSNDLDNGLSFGVASTGQVVTIETSIAEPPTGGGQYEQGGIWFGNGEDDYVKLVVQSRPQGLRLEMAVEEGGIGTAVRSRAPSPLKTASSVGLRLNVDPTSLTAYGEYRLDDGEWRDMHTFDVPAEFFSMGSPTPLPGETRSFAGIMASHRNGPSPVVYMFDDFSIGGEAGESLVLSPGSLSLSVESGETGEGQINLTTSDGSNPQFSVTTNQAYVTVSPVSGTAPSAITATFDATSLAPGTYTASITADSPGYQSASTMLTATVTDPASPALVASPESVVRSLPQGGTEQIDIDVTSTDGSATTVMAASDQSWLTMSGSGTTPLTLTAVIDTAGLTPGSYQATVTFSAGGYESAVTTVALTVSDPNSSCSTVPEEFGVVQVPYVLGFGGDAGGLCDVNGVGTGFTRVDPPSSGTGYIQENLLIDSGELQVTTTAGLSIGSENDMDNALAVGLFPPQEVVLVETTVVEPPFTDLAGSFAQAGLWFGNGEDNYIKLVVQARNQGLRMELLEEAGSVTDQERVRAPSDLDEGDRVGLRLTADPVNLTVTGHYRINDGDWRVMDTFAVPGELFTSDNAGLPPGETRTFAGIMASHRNGPAPVVYRFDDFSVVESSAPPPPPSGGISFTKVAVADVADPTGMAMGPDGRLYVTGVLGKLYRISLDPVTHSATNVEEFNTLNEFYGQSQRLTLGLTVDPDSTASNVVLWIASAEDDGNIGNGGVDTASIVRVSGANLNNVTEYVSGLPRARANHSLNSLHFGPDGRLFVAAGGLTGAGQVPMTNRGEFGNRREQPLSAALLAFDVKDANWDPSSDGACATGVRTEAGISSFPNRIDELVSWTCGVDVFATGFRNMYDFVFHSNGEIYGPDNGLGVSGTFPVESSPDCRYLADGVTPAFGEMVLYTQGGDYPGAQPDLLHRIEEGAYYGHPNPSRDECVFMNGSFQAVAPLANFHEEVADLGEGRSADGVIEYTSGAFCGALQGDLLISNFSSGGDVTRVQLSADGQSVTTLSSLFGGFKNPLPLVQGSDGTVYVGEFDQSQFPGGGKITAMVPNDNGCFANVASMPVAALDPGSASVDGRMYVVGGKIDSGSGPEHVNSLYVYDPVLDQWFTGPDKGGLAVENPAVAAHNGKIYLFGGSTSPFSGFRNEVWIYTPGGTLGNQGTWAQGNTSGFTARAGAAAETLSGQIYVMGGLAGPSGGTSQTIVEIYNPSTNSWTTGPSLSTPRDNAGSAVMAGNIYVFGGRTRVDGVDINGTLATAEYLTGGNWQPRASMPTGRRSFIVGTIGEKAQVMGGESPLFTQNEQYDPATNSWTTLIPMSPGRHGSGYATIGDVLYIAGGGPVGGTSYTNTAVSFQLP